MRRAIVTVVLVVLFLAAGGGLSGLLRSMRQAPTKETKKEVILAVLVMSLARADRAIRLQAYGTLRTPNRVGVVLEVSGEVLRCHPRLEPGERVEKGELLLEVDPRPYALRVEQSRADLARLAAGLRRVAAQQAGDRQRRALLEKSLVLARKEHGRARDLFEGEKVGSQSAVEAAERAVLSVEERLAALDTALTLYPVQEEELRAQVTAMSAVLSTAELNLAKTKIMAPVSGRVESCSVEKGQVVSPGREVLRIVDDAVLELPLTVDGREFVRWIPFKNAPSGRWWFGEPDAGPVEVTWVEDPEKFVFGGRLARVERFDPRTRTATAVVLLDQPKEPDGPRLVPGMFCRARITGRTVRGVFRIPRAGVEPDGTVYLALEGRLARAKVEVLAKEGGCVLVRSDLPDGTLVVLTRLLGPVDGTPLQTTLVAGEKESAQ
jgi:RND family efflux transporter MFP subunit